MATRVVYENFRSFGEMLSIINSRPNGPHMTNEHASQKKDKKWTGTESYKQACDMLPIGYLEVLKKMEKNIEQQNKLNAKFVAEIERPLPQNDIYGYIPCVPAAIQGLPKSMVNINRKPMKRKTLHVLYSIAGTCDKDTDWFIKSGTALLSAIDIVERGGIQTKIDLNFFGGVDDDQYTFPTITIKNYGERYSPQKISFPLVHPSMFRRIGFKWLETNPDIDHHFWAYGRTPAYDDLAKALDIKDPATYLITTSWIAGRNFSVEEILRKFEVIS